MELLGVDYDDYLAKSKLAKTPAKTGKFLALKKS
jgi:hypothetical protein